MVDGYNPVVSYIKNNSYNENEIGHEKTYIIRKT